MSFVSRALGVHINPIKNQYSGFGNAMRDVAYAVAAYYAAPLLLGGGGAGAAAGAGGGAGGAAGGAAGALTEFSAPEIASMGGGLTTGAAGAGIGAGSAGAGAAGAGAAGGGGSGASGFMRYARLAQNMPSMGGGQQGQPMRDWTQPANDYMPKTQQQLLAEALAKQQNANG